MSRRPAGLALRMQEEGAGAVCAAVLAELPQWFGYPYSVADYVESADTHPTVVAVVDGRNCGILTLRVHTPYAAEIVVMGVLPEQHRGGIGRAMLGVAETWLAERDITYLQVKTLSPRSADDGYAATRGFYFGSGFRPLEELPELWGRDSPALQMIKTVPPAVLLPMPTDG
jgi:GNAT superfamily N-acetyltransferase